MAKSFISVKNSRMEQTGTSLAECPEDISLSDRQRKVLELAMEGLKRWQIAKHLGVAEYTVTEHLKTVYKKLRAHNRAEAVAKALAMGLVSNQSASRAVLCPNCGCHLQTEGFH